MGGLSWPNQVLKSEWNKEKILMFGRFLTVLEGCGERLPCEEGSSCWCCFYKHTSCQRNQGQSVVMHTLHLLPASLSNVGGFPISPISSVAIVHLAFMMNRFRSQHDASPYIIRRCNSRPFSRSDAHVPTSHQASERKAVVRVCFWIRSVSVMF